MGSGTGRKRWWLLGLGIIGLALAAGGGLIAISFWVLAPSEAKELPVYFELPAFSFTDQLGRTVTSGDLKGKVIVANFVFTNCTAFCPTVLSPRMRELQGRLRDEGLAGREVVLLSFSVDPEQDTPEKLRAYADNFGADPEVWRFLTGNVADMERVVTMGLKLGVQKILQPVEHTHPDGSAHTHQYDVMHSNRFALVDRQGQVRAYNDGVYGWNLGKGMDDIQYLVGSAR